jgi:hypothetical protein
VTSFFAPDEDKLPTLICTTCGIYARVRGALTLALMARQLERCRDKDHDVTTENLAETGA